LNFNTKETEKLRK